MAAKKMRVLVDVVEAGRKGGLRRNETMTAAERKRIAAEAVRARWARYYAENPEQLAVKQAREVAAAAKAKRAKKAK